MIKSLGFLLLRLAIGTMLIHHGYEKLENIENFADAFVRPLHLPFPIFSSYFAAFSEIWTWHSSGCPSNPRYNIIRNLSCPSHIWI